RGGALHSSGLTTCRSPPIAHRRSTRSSQTRPTRADPSVRKSERLAMGTLPLLRQYFDKRSSGLALHPSVSLFLQEAAARSHELDDAAPAPLTLESAAATRYAPGPALTDPAITRGYLLDPPQPSARPGEPPSFGRPLSAWTEAGPYGFDFNHQPPQAGPMP